MSEIKINKRIVLAGGPGTGKTSVIDELKKKNFYCFEEAAREIFDEFKLKGLEFKTDPIEISKNILKLVRMCNSKKSILMVGYNLRHMKSLSKFREILKKKIIGKILSVRSEVGQYLPSWRINSDYKKSVSAREELGGGVLLELSHDIDYLVWLFGKVN